MCYSEGKEGSWLGKEVIVINNEGMNGGKKGEWMGVRESVRGKGEKGRKYSQQKKGAAR
jgi:hypothetical protein